MILRFDEDGDFCNKSEILTKLYKNIKLKSFPEVYLDIFENYVTEENTIYMKKDKKWYRVTLQISENLTRNILFLGQEKLISLFSPELYN